MLSLSNMQQQVSLLIIAGGRGTRMSGEDKGLMDWRGKPIIEILLADFKGFVHSVVINANRNLQQYKTYGFNVVEDQVAGFVGPLAGVHAGLSAIDTAYTFVTPCDSPNMSHAVLERMTKQLGESDADLAVASLNGHLEPVVLLLKTSLSTSIYNFLNSGNRRVGQWVREQNHITVDFSDAESIFTNINTPDEKIKYAG